MKPKKSTPTWTRVEDGYVTDGAEIHDNGGGLGPAAGGGRWAVSVHGTRYANVEPLPEAKSRANAILRADGPVDYALAQEDARSNPARHEDSEINRLYKARRKAAEASNESGWKGIEGWRSLESIEAELRTIDPDGDWRYEGNLYDGLGWQVRRPVTSDPAERETEVPCPTGSTGTSPIDAHNEGAYMARKTAQTSTTSRIRETAKEIAAKKAAEKKAAEAAPAQEAPAVDLEAILLDGLKAKGVKVTARLAPSKKYSTLLVDGKSIGYVHKPGRKGLRVEPKVGKETKKLAGFTASSYAGFVGHFATEKDVAKAVDALALAAQEVSAKKEAAKKAPAKAAPRKRAATAAPAEQQAATTEADAQAAAEVA